MPLDSIRGVLAQGGVAGLTVSVLMWVFMLAMRGRIVALHTLERELLAEQRFSDLCKKIADERTAQLALLAPQIPRMVALLETMDAHLRATSALSAASAVATDGRAAVEAPGAQQATP